MLIRAPLWGRYLRIGLRGLREPIWPGRCTGGDIEQRGITMRGVVTFAAAIAALLAMAVPVLAKGPERATITGPGVEEPIVIEGNGDDGGTSFGRFVEASGFWGLVFGPDVDGNGAGVVSEAPTDDLGERYTVTWHLADARVVSSVYPYAAGGSLVYVVPDVSMRGFDMKTEGGWFRTVEPLAPVLESYGVVMSAVTSTTAAPPSPVATSVAVVVPAEAETVAAPAASAGPSRGVPFSVVLALTLGITAAWAMRRFPRRAPAP